MIVDTIAEAEVHFDALIEKVLQGEDVIIKKNGKPVAVLSKFENIKVSREPGAFKGLIKISDDFG